MKDSVIKETILVLPIVLSLTIFTVAQRPGSLDTSFGNGGLVSAPTIYNYYYSADDMAIQEDGKIVVGGMFGTETCTGGGGSCSVYVARLLKNGQFDETFGTKGQVFVYPGATSSRTTSIALQPDGKIVVGSNSDHFILRFLMDGSLDPAFDEDGQLALTDLSLEDVTVQPDGKIILVGRIGQGMNSDFASARLNPDGSFDDTFGVNGVSRTHFENAASAALRAVLQSDGKFVSVGFTSNSGNKYLALARYSIDGSLDTSFGNSGKVVTGISTSDARDIVVQDDDKLVVAGTNSDTGLLMRFEPTGSLDASFGTAGIVSKPGNSFQDVAIQSNGKLVVGGGSAHWIGSYLTELHTVSRFLANGSSDLSFGEDGVLHTAFPDEGNISWGGAVHAISIQPDGKIVVAGDWMIGGCGEQCFNWFSHPTIARYTGDAFPTLDFDGDGRSDISVFRPSDASARSAQILAGSALKGG